MKRSVSSSSSHFEAWISSGPVATVLRGPMEAVAMSLPESAYSVQGHEGFHQPTGYGEEITWYRNLLFEGVKKSARFSVLPRPEIFGSSRQATGDDWQRRSNVEVEGRLHIRGILTGEERSCVDCLTLRDCGRRVSRHGWDQVRPKAPYTCKDASYSMFELASAIAGPCSLWWSAHESVVRFQRLLDIVIFVCLRTSTSTIFSSSTPSSRRISRALPYGSNLDCNAHLELFP